MASGQLLMCWDLWFHPQSLVTPPLGTGETATRSTRREKTPPPSRCEKTPPPSRREKTPPKSRREKTPPPSRREKTPPHPDVRRHLPAMVSVNASLREHIFRCPTYFFRMAGSEREDAVSWSPFSEPRTTSCVREGSLGFEGSKGGWEVRSGVPASQGCWGERSLKTHIVLNKARIGVNYNNKMSEFQ